MTDRSPPTTDAASHAYLDRLHPRSPRRRRANYCTDGIHTKYPTDVYVAGGSVLYPLSGAQHSHNLDEHGDGTVFR